MEPAAKRTQSDADDGDGVGERASPVPVVPTEPPESCVFTVDPSCDGLSSAALAHYQRYGFVVLRQLIGGDEADEVREEMHRIINEWYDRFEETGVEQEDWKSMVNREDRARNGELKINSKADRYLSVRRLFRMAVHDTYFHDIACQRQRMQSISSQLLGEDVKLLQSMALLKPPGAAEKRWHQDNGYFRLTPNHVMAMWIAIDEATVENGCMHVVPATHTHGVDEHKSLNGNHKLYSLTKTPDEKTVVPMPLKPGDALVFHGELHHFTPPNKSSSPRYALQLHYASGKCKPTVCPKPDKHDITASSEESQAQAGPDETHTKGSAAAFDCDPCVEPQFWYYRKAERHVIGRDYGDPHI
eukprot:scpid79806/ scgid8065/ Phytanoyl-CoA dioxygenase domain-containing protein 1